MPIATDIERIRHIVSEYLDEEFRAQGHHMTGAAVRDIEYKVDYDTNSVTISGYAYPYANILAAGVKASKIPYSGRTGRGGVSKYIQALQSYAELRMNITDPKESLSVAFAIAATQKKEGMPTRGSYKYSRTGKRTDFVAEALRKGEDRLSEAIRQMGENTLSVSIDAILEKWNIELNI